MGDGYSFSTFVPGAGLTSVALDASGKTLLASGSVSLGQFPVDTNTMPLGPGTYQVLLKLPLDGSTVLSGTLIAPGTQSYVAAAGDGAVWVDGTLSAPLLPIPALSGVGTGFAVRVNASGTIDQTARFGGVANGNPSFASLPLNLAALAVDSMGQAIVGGSAQPTASSALLATETYDLALRNAATAALPSALSDAKLQSNTCNGSLCGGSAAYLAKLNPAFSAPALSFSVDAAPRIVLRNLGSAAASGLVLAASSAALTSDCGSTLAPGAGCNLLLNGVSGAAGSVSASASNSSTETAPYAAFTAPADTLVVTPKEMDFGIQSAASPAVSQTLTLTVTNLGPASKTFTSAVDSSTSATSPFTESSSDCASAGSAGTKILGGNGTCHIIINFDASAVTTRDGSLQSAWLIGTQDILLTATSQAAALGVSSTKVDFGTQIAHGLRLPRYLYLSNNSSSAVAHAQLAMAPGSPFTVQDECPSMLQPHSVCRIRLDYLAAQQTSTDSTTLTLDDGISVLVTGETVPAQSVTGTAANPNLSVTPSSVTFAGSTVVTAVSTSYQTVTISNTGPAAFSLLVALSGDFIPTSNCGQTLAGHQNCLVQLSFAPSQPGTRQGLLSVSAGAGTSAINVALSGLATPLFPVANGSIDFGSSVVGTPVERFFKVSQPFTNLTASASGPYSLALIEDQGFGPGQPPASSFSPNVSGTCSNCYLAVLFQPTAVGQQPGSVMLSSSGGGSTYMVALTGVGSAATGLVLTPAVADFGSVPVHSVSGPTLFTLTNLSTDGTDVVVNAPALSGDFAFATTSTGGAACGGTLAYTASCFVAVDFAPTQTASRSGTLTLSYIGGNGSQTVQAALSGTGSADPGIALNPIALTYRNVPGPSATRQTVTVTNTSLAAELVGVPVTASSAFSATSGCASVLPGASCTVIVNFVPGQAEDLSTLSIPATFSNGGNAQTATYTVALDGAYTLASAGLQVVPGQAQYGAVATSTEGPVHQFTINNLTGKTLALAITIPRNFVLVGEPCSALAPNGSCNFQVEFLPLTGGPLTGSLFARAIPSDGSAAVSAIGYLQGFGVGHGSLAISGGLVVNSVFDFNQVASGQKVTHALSVTNTTTDPAAPPITIRRVSSEPPFLSVADCASPLTTGTSCTISVTYSPINQVGSGTSSPSTIPDMGQLVIESDAATSPNVLDLLGKAGPLVTASPNNTGPLATFSLSQGSLAFASTVVGDVSAAQSVTLANTGTVALHLGSLLLPPDFTLLSTCIDVLPGQNCTLTVTSTPVTAGTHIGSLQITSDAATALEFVSLYSTSTPSTLITTPQTLDFGLVVVESSSTLPVQVTNSSSTNVQFTSVSASGDYVAGGSCPAAGGLLTANSSCTVEVVFTPKMSGTRTGMLSIATSASTLPLQVALTGIAIQSHLVVTPSALAFGNVVEGVASNQTLTLANTGNAQITNLALVTRGDYAVSIPCATQVLAPGQSCSVQITFLPTELGERDGTLTVTSSDLSSPLLVPLTGAGIRTGGFALSVDGGLSSTVSVPSGQPAAYHLAVTPTLGFSGAVALTCTPVHPATYASCSISPSQITLVSSPLNSAATIMTLASLGGNARLNALQSGADPRPLGVFVCLLLPGAYGVFKLRKPLRGRLPVLLALIITACTLVAIGCGSGGDPRIRYAPVGKYQYLVTASSISGIQDSQTVILNLVITKR